MKKTFLIIAIIGLLTIFSFGQKMSYGTIEGKLIYPSDYIPETMIVCVQNRDIDKTICSNSKTKDYQFNLDHKKATYSVKLPAGEYFVFAAFPYGQAPSNGMEGYEAFYTEFVKCGLSVDCQSHEKIAVKVKAGETVADISPGDWYENK